MIVSSFKELLSLIRQGNFKKISEKVLLKYGSHEKVFKIIYKNNLWGSRESISGPGSELHYTEGLIKELPKLFHLFNIHSVIDAPCGDFNYMQMVNLSEISYLGADIVDELILEDKKKFESDNIRFIKLNLVKEILPYADLIISRDMFIHFSFKDAKQTIENFRKSSSKYLLTNTYPDVKVNKDITTGSWRPVNLDLPPYNLNDIIYSIHELSSPSYGRKLLALYPLK